MLLPRRRNLLSLLVVTESQSRLFNAERFDNIELEIASQAAYEGSIPFTRSSRLFNRLEQIGSPVSACGFTACFTGDVLAAFNNAACVRTFDGGE